jgi:putative ABC transport system permease protein
MPHEPRIPGLRRAVRLPGDRIERDVNDEITFHLESRVRELITHGQPEELARRIAEAEFGDLGASRHELAALDRHRRRRDRAGQWLAVITQDLRHAVRSLWRSPAFSVAAVLMLVIGIGTSVAIFALVNGVLLRPLPFGNPTRLIAALHDLPAVGLNHEPQAPSTYFTYQRLARTIDGIGVYREGEVNVAEPGGSAEPQRLTSASVSATLIPVLQVSPLLGRVFTAEDDRPGAPPVILISESMWRNRFGADPGILAHRLDVNGVSSQIVGIMPARFRFPAAGTQLWTPAQLDPVNPPPTAFAFGGVARLKTGVTVADAERDFAAVLPRVAELFSTFVPGITIRMMLDQMQPRPSLVPLRTEIVGGIARTLWTLAAAALLVLLVACANVANLMIVRAESRQRELAVREALGAGRARVMLHFFAEVAVLVGTATLFGLGAAAVAVRSLVATGPAGIPRLAEVRIDAATLVFTLAVGLLVTMACALIPALRIGHGVLALRDGGRSGTAGRVQQRLRSGLVAAQMALALVVLAGSGLLVRTFQRLHAVRPGFDSASVSTFWISLPVTRYKRDSAVVRFYSRLAERVAALPGVAAVGLTSRLPFESHGVNQNPLYPEDDPSFGNKLPPLQLFTAVSDGYFGAMRIPLIAGRTFDGMGAQRDGEAIVSRSTARFFWKDSTGIAALGKRFRPLPTDAPYTVVGVVGDTRDTALAAPPTQAVYFPEVVESKNGLETRRAMALVVRTMNARVSVAPAVQQAVHNLDPTLPIFDTRPMGEVLAAATAQLAFIIFILGGATVVTLILGAVGLYGVLAYVVTLRTRELGIRIALGASPREVAVAMMKYGIALSAIGTACGLGIFALSARFLRALLFGVATYDPAALGGATLTLTAIAGLASWVPARRAARIDPSDALRTE